jgi:uncharacterized membrane protein HdeD (DUF308 family)
MMDWFWVAIIAAYVTSYAFGFWFMCEDHLKSFGKVTRGDMAFFTFLSTIPLVGIIVGIISLCNSRFEGFWSKEVWRK